MREVFFTAFAGTIWKDFSGIGEKRIDVVFLEVVMRFVKLALDGPEFAAAALLGNEVNAGVLTVAIRPFVPLPDFGEEVLEMGVLLKKGFGDFFKAISAFPVDEGFFSDFGDSFFKVHFCQRPAERERALFFRFRLFCAPAFLPRNKKHGQSTKERVE